MIDVHPIVTNSEVFSLYCKQKSEFHFTQRTDDDFVMFLLDTAVRVISIVQHLAPVIEAVSASVDYEDDVSLVSLEDEMDVHQPLTHSQPLLPTPHTAPSTDLAIHQLIDSQVQIATCWPIQHYLIQQGLVELNQIIQVTVCSASCVVKPSLAGSITQGYRTSRSI